MDQVIINDKDTVVMNLVHYFVTEQNYNPVVVHGINDEIWLENMNNDYKIVRIISRYIHNNEQLNFNRFRSRQITKKLRLKTLSFRMNVLSIYIDLGDNVTTLEEDIDNNLSIFIKDISDIKNNPTIMEIFPNISEKTDFKEEGIELLFKITDDINKSNETKNKKMDKLFSSKKTIVTYIIIGLCVFMFALTSGGYNSDTMIKYGASVPDLIKNGEYFRIFTSMFLHFGIMHIVLNMYSLYIVGPRVEDFFGKWKFTLIYLISGISGCLLSVGLNDNVISAGASGAIFGLFGALLYFGYNYRGYIGTMVRSQILPIIIYNLIIGFIIPGIDIWAHVGGLIGGIITANMVGTIEKNEYKFNNILIFLIYFGFLVYFALFM